MRPFSYARAASLAQAVQMGQATGAGQTDAPVQFLAGGTTLYDLMKLDVMVPDRVVDLTPLRSQHAAIVSGPDGLHLGALARMAQVADDPAVRGGYPVLAESLQLAASAQLRNMATLGGNVLQRTRCTYFRDPSWSACNKRSPGSGCAALAGFNRNHAVLGTDASCIAQYPGDFAVALIALEAQLDLAGPQGSRRIPFAMLHRPADGQPHLETNLRPGEVITSFFVPASARAARSTYVKVRDRASYEFAIASAAVALEMEGDVVRQARIGLGGMAYRPWRAPGAEAALTGKPLTGATAEAAAAVAMRGAMGRGQNDYKLALGRQTIVRALMQAKAMPDPSRKT
jgi:xanthine dehydrogenase YagS FAD-binding subunit